MRPIRSVNSLKTDNILSSENVTNENAVLWWKYAIKSVIKLQREKKGSIYEFHISKTKKKEYEMKFIKLFEHYLKDEEYDQDELHHIIVAVEKKDLEKWVTYITKTRIDKETKKANEASWFGFFKSKRVEEELKHENEISSEEIEEVYKTLQEKFTKNDDYEEVKDVSEIKNIQAELMVKKGGLNLVYK